MQLRLTSDDFKDKSVFVATPMYGGQCHGIYAKASNDLAIACTQHGIGLKFYYLFNESLITRARNYCVDEFLRSDCTHLMFIDSDIGFNHTDVLALLYLTNPDEGRDIVTGPYPKKTIAWEKIKLAVDKGFANENPHELENFVGDFVFNPTTTTSSFRIDEPVEIREGGTGFMCIHRSVFEKYAEAYPDLKYLPDHARSEHFDGTREITAYFDTIIDPESRRYLSEDYMFSHYARAIGLKVWLCPWMQLKHCGSFMFGGSIGALAAIQASPTASKESNAKHYLTNKKKSGRIKSKSKNRRGRK